MSTLYTTSDYFNDSYWFFEKFGEFIIKAKRFLKGLGRGATKTEFETVALRIIENLPYGILILFLGFYFSVLLLRVSESPNGIRVFNITTSSMSPVIKPGSMLFSFPTGSYNVNDIVSYREKNPKTNTYTGRSLTHRIIDKKAVDGYYVYTIKGDNNPNPDPDRVRTSDINGRVFLILPFMGYIDFLIRTVPGFIIFIALPSILLIKEARSYLFQKN